MHMPLRSVEEMIFAQELRSLSAELASFDDVVQVMQRIQAELSQDDGVWWFTELYRQVTLEVRAKTYVGFFLEPVWMEELVIQFSRLYFDALWLWLSGEYEACPPSWRVLFRRRFYLQKRGYSKLQFALAGVNAHIQRDLGFAAHFSRRYQVGSAEIQARIYQDYVKVNEILEEVEVSAMRAFATGWIKRLSDRMHPVDRLAAMTMIRLGRWLAWRTTGLYFSLLKHSPKFASWYLWMLEYSTALYGRILLLPMYS